MLTTGDGGGGGGVWVGGWGGEGGGREGGEEEGGVEEVQCAVVPCALECLHKMWWEDGGRLKQHSCAQRAVTPVRARTVRAGVSQ